VIEVFAEITMYESLGLLLRVRTSESLPVGVGTPVVGISVRVVVQQVIACLAIIEQRFDNLVFKAFNGRNGVGACATQIAPVAC
jgi:hypothetical protein